MSRNGDGSAEKRPYVRYSPRIYGVRDLSLCYEGRSERISTRPPDLSDRGMFINTANRFPEGAILNVTFRLHHVAGEVSARCEVRYCLAGVGVGVEFTDISPQALKLINQEIALSRKRSVKAKPRRRSVKSSRK
jgi:hypothetical protein